MDRRLLILGAAVVIVALIIAAVPVAGSQTSLLKKILKGVQALQEPTGYEYYTSMMKTDSFNPVFSSLWITNLGDTSSEVYSEVLITKDGIHFDKSTYNPTVEPNQTWGISIALSADRRVSYKITTNSKYIIPRVRFTDQVTGMTITEYLPGDFQKIEVYS